MAGETIHAWILAYFTENPHATSATCAAALGLDKSTVGKHVQRLRAEGVPIRRNRHAGEYGAKIGAANRERVREFYAAHIGCTALECSEAIGIAPAAISRHIQAIKSEWKGKQDG